MQIFLIGPLLELQPEKSALKAVNATHSQFKGDFAFATAALGTDPADMLLDFFGLERSKEIQVISQALNLFLMALLLETAEYKFGQQQHPS